MPADATLAPVFVDVGTSLEEAPGLARYLLVFLLAMIPAVEPFIVIPAAIGLGLDPILTGLAAFTGSVTAVGIIVLAQQRIAAWWSHRTDGESNSSNRYDRAQRLWKRYGLAGLSFAGPILAGIHLTALLATVVSNDTGRVIGWLSVGLAAWTAALVAGSVFGFSLVGLA
ncbi:small multi-drug export protein [Natronolimnohabitans innermongolicus]|uniref:Small multi-drug export protein n=1 Tax=Natronolimnohabitans innermongolicus JCM 12255 TaxID=1227499 RepID=L9XAK6_9EURY|nr:small multi-drug export protein [Natronolimnohabitans innermongolicus]ELY58667.1 hypothetical protein C493_06672 [Natronolimnohabitans innermongolicus JCM 12255]